jgi:CHAT domain-containing protein/Tfp pilus assembly protein PilF
MIRKIWQRILNLWRQIQQRFRKPAPPPPPPTTLRSFQEYEQKFMALLEGVAEGWSRGEIKGFLIGCKIKDAEWVNWLQDFGERLLVSPDTNLELGRRMVRLGEMNCGRISEVAGNIGKELLAGESLNPTPAKDSFVEDENIVTPLLDGESLSVSSTDNLDAVNQFYVLTLVTSESKSIALIQEAMELLEQGLERSKAGDLEGEIAAYEKALKINPQLYLAWTTLGIALHGLKRNSEAIAAFKTALEIEPKDYEAWSGLGIVLKNLGRYSEAIAAFDKALESTDYQYWEAWLNRGWAFVNSGRYIEAIQNWDEGLQKFLPSNRDYRLDCGKLHQAKGEAHYIYGKQTFTYWESFHKAKASYEQAREFLKSPLIPETYLEVMQGLITVCRSLGDPKTSEYLAEATTVLENLILDNETHPEIKQRLQRKFAGLYQLEVDTLVESGDKVNALEKAELRKNFCLQWMRAASPNRTASPTYPQIRDLLTNNTETAIIYWHLSPVSLTAFIITPDKFEVIATPVTDIFAKRNSHSLEKWLENWKTNYQNYCQTTSKQQSKESHPWRESMTAQLPQLADILKIPEISTHLTNIQHLILIPHRDLHLLPLDALFLPPFQPPQICTISRLPSAQIAILQQQQNPTETIPNSLLMVEHSQGKSALKYTEIEAATISQFYATQRPSNAATKTAIIQALKTNSGIFHYTGHAYHNTEKSENSALILAEGEELTLTDILQINFINYYLICLSACETGFTKTGELIDEFVGIASGFLPETNYIISTLWRVDERSSALLTIYFYQLLQQGIQPPAALQQAKDWLRELTNGKLGEWYSGELLPLLREANFNFQHIFFFEMEASRLQENLDIIDEKPYQHPYHWAAFTITGNG